MSRLDIAFVVPSLVRGGAERVTVNLARGLTERGWSVRVLLAGSLDPLATELPPTVEVVRFGRSRVRNALSDIVREVRARPTSVIMSTHTHVNLALCAARPLIPRNTRLVLRSPIHAPDTLEGRSMRASRIAQRMLYPRADAIIASSDELARDLAGLTRRPITRIENPVDITSVRSDAERATAAARDDADHGRRFVSVGRLAPQKGFGDLLTAFARGADPDDRLDIIGEGAQRSELETLMHELRLDDRVTLPGIVPDHWQKVATADAFVLASYAEGMPNAVLEALALGTPVIVTDELDVLRDLAREIPSDALRMVPRSDLATAIHATPRRTEPFPSASKLPQRFDLRETVEQFDRLLRALLADDPTVQD